MVVDVLDDGRERDEVQEPRRDTGREREPHEEAAVGEGAEAQAGHRTTWAERKSDAKTKIHTTSTKCQ